ncbi:MAG: hypothetical protein J2P41_00165 [Blastocatellia bacterium]|nr:hypothetical protein [Blastocatellia bacterium]
MTVAFDQNGNPYDVQTNNAVDLVYDGAGNAIDANTGTPVDVIVSPDQTTVYTQAQNPTGWAQTVSTIASSVFRPTTPYPSYTSTYNPYYSPSSAFRPAPGVTTSVSPSGVGLNISPTTLLIIAVVGAAFLFGKKGR